MNPTRERQSAKASFFCSSEALTVLKGQAKSAGPRFSGLSRHTTANDAADREERRGETTWQLLGVNTQSEGGKRGWCHRRDLTEDGRPERRDAVGSEASGGERGSPPAEMRKGRAQRCLPARTALKRPMGAAPSWPTREGPGPASQPPPASHLPRARAPAARLPP